jgi:DNA-binding NtrC family response regulator
MHFVKKFAGETGCDVSQISRDALALLMDYDWPGNVRELENFIHRSVVLATGETIDSGLLPPEVRDGAAQLTVRIPRTSEELKQRKKELREKAVEEVERRFVVEALKRNDWNVTRAAGDVGMQRPNFQALMREHRVTLPKGSPASPES